MTVARVRTVREHQNLYGDKPAKAVGDEYDLPDNLVDSLSGAKLVERVDGEDIAVEAKAKRPAKGSKA